LGINLHAHCLGNRILLSPSWWNNGYDLVNAALNAGIDNIYYSGLRLKALDALESSPQFEPQILMAKRVNNIITGQPAYAVNAGLFVEKEEPDPALPQ